MMDPTLTTTSRATPISAPKGSKSGFPERLSGWIEQHPAWGILLVSLLAVVVNCYPIIFCGRSFVSPACMQALVYPSWPPLPGMSPAQPISQHGSDTGAMMVWGIPAGFIASRSLLQEGELPLWDRYGHAGSTFIGQAVSMLGDPLQLIVIVGRGAAGAWDLKFLAAKFLFCAGFGLLIFRLVGSHPLALIQAALAAYCGAFFYINNHPVFFAFAYSPWILLSAVELLDRQSKQYSGWGLVWLLANVACFNGGHVEVGVVLIGGLNLAALAHAVSGCRKLADLAVVLGRITVAGALFLGLTAPVWMSFLASLPDAFSTHSEVKVYQLPARCVPGLFDDLFYHFQLPSDALAAIAPGASLLVLAGFILSLLRWRQLQGYAFFIVNNMAILVWGGCVFGWVPAFVLEAIPMLNRVGHNFVDFSYLLILHLTIASAFGFKALASEINPRQMAVDALGLVAGFTGLMLLYCLANGHRPILWSYFECAAAGAIGAPLLYAFLRSRGRRISGLGWTGIFLLGFSAQFRFGLYSTGNQNLLMVPGTREVLNAPSQSLEWIKTDRAAPFRVAGLGWSLLGDYAAVYGLEDIRSCAPLTSGSYENLVVQYPGIKLSEGWIIDITDPATAQPLLNLLNVKYLLAPPKIGVQPGLDFRVAQRSDFGVLENLDAWPRAFFAGQVLSIASTGEFIHHLWANGKQPFIALTPKEIERQPGLRSLETTNTVAVSAATHYQLRVNSTAFDIHAASAGVVCLTENQAHDFTATANGTPKAVLTVNRAFKGLYLDQPGDYHLEFTYRPGHWRLALVLFWLAAALTAALAAASFTGARIRRTPQIIAQPKS
jgi:hypothetical protein